ncbi:DNA methyltransferase [Parabacteroides merdae]|uniref:DNA methyltransferase n=1 Tax=Parabacteroides merdae TaxID=46503 RepID=UPI003F969D8E
MEKYKRQIDNRWSFKTANTKEFTHCYHAYPAMMIPQIARTLIEEYSPNGKCELLFDPYCGSGTSLVEASLKGINSIGTDLNPLARLMARVKTTKYDVEKIKSLFSEIQSNLIFYSEEQVLNRNFDRISNYTYWYSEESLLKLSYLSQLIDSCEVYSDFFNVALSEVVREVSFTRNGEFKRFRMKEEKIKSFNPNVFRLFEEKVIRNIEGLKEFNNVANNYAVRVCSFNSSIAIPNDIIQDETVDLVVTSPPYGDSRTTVAYGQFSRWANEWFDFENAQNLDSLLMGGKKCNVECFDTISIKEELQQIKQCDENRYYEVVSFLNDYWASIQNVARKIRKGGVVCYVVGNRNVKGVQIPLDYFTAEMFEKLGFEHNITIVREIPNKRMPLKTSPTNKSGLKVNTMNNEYIVIMKKEGL